MEADFGTEAALSHSNLPNRNLRPHILTHSHHFNHSLDELRFTAASAFLPPTFSIRSFPSAASLDPKIICSCLLPLFIPLVKPILVIS